MLLKRLMFFLVLIFIFGLAYYCNLQSYFTLEGIKERQILFSQYYSDNPVRTILIYFAIYIFVTAISLPGATVFSLLGGALFGTLNGTIIVLIASTIGATFAFGGARYLFRDLFQKKFGEKLPAFSEGIKREGGFYLFTLRLIPIVPFFVINIVMGLTPMKLWPYFWISLIGMLPGTFVYVYAGQQLSEIQSVSQLFSMEIIFALVLLGVFPYCAKFVVSKFRFNMANRK